MTHRHRLAAACFVLVFAIAACGRAAGSGVPSLPPSPAATSTVGSPPVSFPASAEASHRPVLDQPWATVELTDVTTGDVFRVADHAGKVIIIETMAIWCPSCLLQEREVDAALGRLDPDAVTYIVLDIDLNEDAAALADYRAEHGFRGIYAVAGIPVARALAEEFGANMLNPPLTPIVIVGTDGVARLTDHGRKSADELVSLAIGAGA